MFTGPMAAADDKDSSWLVFKSEFFQLHYRFQFESDANKFKGFFESGIEALEGGNLQTFLSRIYCVFIAMSTRIRIEPTRPPNIKFRSRQNGQPRPLFGCNRFIDAVRLRPPLSQQHQ